MSATGDSGVAATTADGPTTERGAFATVPRRLRGYRPAQVDALLARVREAWATGSADASMSSGHVRDAVFDLVRGGYDARAVDAELDRWEDALARREHDDEAARRADLDHALAVIRARLGAAPGNRFRAPTGRRPGYRRHDVDALCQRVDARLAGEAPLRVQDVRAARFPAVRGAEAYDAAQVDLFLDRVIDVLRIHP
ncbi:DivIVA domain-containing protein [Tersicoccus phoenicis]|uniref:DivIVA domain-containing protein n=1 Tax=Tersicoccus phoenicis TaxID=554083 RepID=UPI000A05E4E6|nr:DivIVA domain-containing protein [Tersicoccus phoenicis]